MSSSNHTLPWKSPAPNRFDTGLALQGSGKKVIPIHSALTKHELYAFARYFAGELKNRTKDATDLTPEWYQEQVGEDVCSLAQAEELRRMTIERCKYSESGREVRDSVLWDKGTDIGLPKKLRDGRSEMLNALSWVMIIMVILIVGSWLDGQSGPDDFEYPNNAPVATQAVQ